MEEEKMAVKIRLRRMGSKKAPFYRVVVADSRYPRDGRFIEEIGTYNPITDPATVNIDADMAKKWLANGAQPTDTVKALLVKIAERWSANEQIVISTKEAEELKAYFAKNAKALLDKGVEIKQVNGIKTAFSIAPADGSYKVNFGEGEFEAFFKAFLRPQMVELLFS